MTEDGEGIGIEDLLGGRSQSEPRASVGTWIVSIAFPDDWQTKVSLPGDKLVEVRLRPQVEGAVVDRRGGHAAVGEFVRGKDVVGLCGGEDRRLAILIGAVDLAVGDDR
jgi:hypothetical protein